MAYVCVRFKPKREIQSYPRVSALMTIIKITMVELQRLTNKDTVENMVTNSVLICIQICIQCYNNSKIHLTLNFSSGFPNILQKS